MTTAEAIASLQRQISHMQHQLDAIAGPAASTSAPRSFVPVGSTDCYGVTPCVHTTPASRIAAGCTEAVWRGSFGPHVNFTHARTAGGSGGTHERRPLPPPPDRIPPQPFRPSVGEQCDLVDVWTLSKLHKGHVRLADEAAWHQRLRGVKDALWLSIGSSIDLLALKEACAAFGQEKEVIDADTAPSSLPLELRHESGNPWPSVLLVSWCHVRSLNLTLAHVVAQGIATTALQTNASLQSLRFAEIEAQLARIPTASAIPRTPTFISFGGIEWDFRNWRCDYPRPTCTTEWREPIATLEMQARAARRALPSVKAVFVRTVFKPTTGGFGCDCCAKEAAFLHYNELLRQNAGRRGWWGDVRGVAGGDNNATATASCEGIHVLDLQRMMLCNESVGSCAGKTGWTVDGLHPSRPVVLGYVALALQVMADWGTVCASPSSPATPRATPRV
jgi:hypothetical protein